MDILPLSEAYYFPEAQTVVAQKSTGESAGREKRRHDRNQIAVDPGGLDVRRIHNTTVILDIDGMIDRQAVFSEGAWHAPVSSARSAAASVTDWRILVDESDDAQARPITHRGVRLGEEIAFKKTCGARTDDLHQVEHPKVHSKCAW